MKQKQDNSSKKQHYPIHRDQDLPTVQLTYSSESGSGKGSDIVRRIAIIPKLQQLLSDPQMTQYDPLLTTKESHQLGFNIDVLRAIFDDDYFRQAYAERQY